MISKTQIKKNLTRLHKLYLTSPDILNGEFYSKLAILELCGWIEESMDDIVTRCLNRKIINAKYKNPVVYVIKKNFGFEYEPHFSNMLRQVIGVIGVEKLERKVDSSKFVKMCSALSSLKTCRDKQAHTHTIGVTRLLNAPSWTLGQFQIIYEGLKEMDTTLIRIKY